MNAGQIELAKSYITWMRRKITLSLDGYYPGWENAARDDIGDDDTCAPSIGRVEGPTARLHVVCSALKNRELPPAASRDTRRLPDLKRENPSFAALLIKYVNERFGGDAPKVYNAAHVNRKTYSAIVGNELRPVSKTTAVQFALALHLTRAEADEFIKSAGYAFSASILEDIIVCACIEAKIYDITDVNSLLTEYGGGPFAPEEDT